MEIVTYSGKNISEGVRNMFAMAAAQTKSKSGMLMGEIIRDALRDHVQQRYPGSSHWNPEKIKITRYNANECNVEVGIAGASRAFHDVTIVPKNANWLTIPLNEESRGKTAAQIIGLFRPKGKNVLSVKKGGELVHMFALSKRAFQKQDPSLLPTEDQLGEMCLKGISDLLSEQFSIYAKQI